MSQVAYKIGLYKTPEHACNYLPGRQARNAVVDPDLPLGSRNYSILAANGFRRSGEYVYRPDCSSCSACVPVRIDIKSFSMRRKHRRIWQRNRDLSIRKLPAEFREEHYFLYRQYVSARHKNGGMDNSTPEEYMQFLTSEWTNTEFIEMRYNSRLVAIAVTDVLADSLSAVYTFFDPAEQKRSPGIFAILYQINDAADRNLDWLYLGYWIAGCEKMNYKNDFPAIQYFHGNRWSIEVPAGMPG